MLIFFSISALFLFFIAHKKQINLISIYGVFLLFSILYNLIPGLNAYYGVNFFSLSFELDLINTQLLISSLSNFVFGAIYLLYYKNILYVDIPKNQSRFEKSTFTFNLIIFLITLPLSYYFGWHEQFASEALEGGLMLIITSYMKLFFVACYLYYIVKFGLNRRALILMMLHTIVMIVDGSRTTYLPILIITLYILQSKFSEYKVNNSTLYAYTVIGIALILVTRGLVMSTDETLITNMLMSLVIEACAGSYVSLQTIYGTNNILNLSYTFGTTYLIDPIAWLIPQSPLRNDLLTYNRWFNSLTPALDEKFAPMGGFYYIAEAMSVFPYAGPPFVTGLFAYLSVLIENNKNRNRILFLVYFSTIGTLFSKTIFGNVMKLFIVEFLFIGLFVVFDKMTSNLKFKSS